MFFLPLEVLPQRSRREALPHSNAALPCEQQRTCSEKKGAGGGQERIKEKTRGGKKGGGKRRERRTTLQQVEAAVIRCNTAHIIQLAKGPKN